MIPLILIVTNRCQMRCSHCFRDKDEHSLSLELADSVLEQAHNLGYVDVNLTGGEVCLHPQYEELINLIAKRDFKFTIVSNAWNYEKYIPLLVYDGLIYISFSLDGSEEIHDALRQPGSFNRVIDAIHYFRAHNRPVGISSCINQKNKHQIKLIYTIAAEAGATWINFLSVTPDFAGHNAHLLLSDEEKTKVFKEVIELRKANQCSSLRISTRSSLKTSCSSNIEFCHAMDGHGFSILPTGKVNYCCDLDEDVGIFGDVNVEPLENIILRGIHITHTIRKQRAYFIKNNITFEGFNCCQFCLKMFKAFERIRENEKKGQMGR